ncbi:DUF1956 domain-containing protein [Sphingomonas sp. AAP5]|uniref:CerR family C-terminal domain-containing protein n=1 Tax=Sphingomonas sp. AAP5 TaxID=1523415 RepID=UPI00105718DA|nr:CerR family C-terminal domain-containing protein [Sphingomonas sp. AAP5]QBM75157.1 DUF1956 domain-containing protein [Sphingomonas sp. AAP5]
MSRAALLDIAIREFGEKGLDGASTRSIAKAAGTAMSAITYHFGGKRGLYLAAAEHIARSMREVLAVGDLSDGQDNARWKIHAILNRLADKMLSDQSEGWSLFIIREQLRPSEAFTCFYNEAIGQSISRLAALVELSTGAAPDVARLTAALLFGHVTALRSTRATLLRVLERPTMDEESMTSIKRRVADNTNAILDQLAIRMSVR